MLSRRDQFCLKKNTKGKKKRGPKANRGKGKGATATLKKAKSMSPSKRKRVMMKVWPVATLKVRPSATVDSLDHGPGGESEEEPAKGKRGKTAAAAKPSKALPSPKAKAKAKGKAKAKSMPAKTAAKPKAKSTAKKASPKKSESPEASKSGDKRKAYPNLTPSEILRWYFEAGNEKEVVAVVADFATGWQDGECNAKFKADLKASLPELWQVGLTMYWTRAGAGTLHKASGKELGNFASGGARRELSWATKMSAAAKVASMFGFMVDSLVYEGYMSEDDLPGSDLIEEMKNIFKNILCDALSEMAV